MRNTSSLDIWNLKMRTVYFFHTKGSPAFLLQLEWRSNGNWSSILDHEMETICGGLQSENTEGVWVRAGGLHKGNNMDLYEGERNISLV